MRLRLKYEKEQKEKQKKWDEKLIAEGKVTVISYQCPKPMNRSFIPNTGSRKRATKIWRMLFLPNAAYGKLLTKP